MSNLNHAIFVIPQKLFYLSLTQWKLISIEFVGIEVDRIEKWKVIELETCLLEQEMFPNPCIMISSCLF